MSRSTTQYLLDTHIWIWILTQPSRLGADVTKLLRHPENTLLFSTVCSWEMAIKTAASKLKLPKSLPIICSDLLSAPNVEVLNIRHKHTFPLVELEKYHKDPFDRMLLSQAKADELILVSADKKMKQYRDIQILAV